MKKISLILPEYITKNPRTGIDGLLHFNPEDLDKISIFYYIEDLNNLIKEGYFFKTHGISSYYILEAISTLEIKPNIKIPFVEKTWNDFGEYIPIENKPE